MERGPLTLFGAIVAFGLGPSMWLGAQLGTVNIAPNERPSTVGEQYPESDRDFGGVGAGETPEQAGWVRVDPGLPVTRAASSPAVVPSSPSPKPTFVAPRPTTPSPAAPSSPSVTPSTSASVVPLPPSPSSGTGSPAPSTSASDEASQSPEPSQSVSDGDDEGEGGAGGGGEGDAGEGDGVTDQDDAITSLPY
ncbi:hypothetical protein [Actinoplanes sp. DH11]|uniref:hypothetical protein n=1 Tax=Actinoplanes sp. DH11 TaxID=2857011 RepID=UPI001E485896|nr:hypothetical protein [Actinoplanes sp. DH11]